MLPGVKISVIGCGYLGAVHAACMADFGHEVVGIDVDPEKVRKVMKGECPAGSAIRLFDFEEVLGVAEGIETAISASLLYNVPVWSLLNANGIKEFQPPKQVKRLMVFADNDENYVGQHAAFCLAMRARTMKIETEVIIPATVGEDWNDELLKRSRSARAA